MRGLVWLEQRVCGRREVGNDTDTVHGSNCAKKFTLYPEGMGRSLKVRKEERHEMVFILER